MRATTELIKKEEAHISEDQSGLLFGILSSNYPICLQGIVSNSNIITFFILWEKIYERQEIWGKIFKHVILSLNILLYFIWKKENYKEKAFWITFFSLLWFFPGIKPCIRGPNGTQNKCSKIVIPRKQQHSRKGNMNSASIHYVRNILTVQNTAQFVSEQRSL